MLFSIVKRTTVLGIVWLVLTGGSISALVYALAAVPAGIALSFLLLEPGPGTVNMLRLASLLPGFIMRSVAGGVDVAWRALHPRMPVRPGWISLRTQMTDSPARSLYGAETSLLPGTLSAGCDQIGLKIHCLYIDQDTEQRVQVGERRFARAFSQPGSEPDADG